MRYKNSSSAATFHNDMDKKQTNIYVLITKNFDMFHVAAISLFYNSL